MLDDNKITNEIKDKLEKYEIKTKSNTILHAFYNQEEPIEIHKKRFSFAKIIPFATLGVLAVSIIVAINSLDGFIIDDPASEISSETEEVIENESPSEQTAFSLFSALTFINKKNTSSTLSRKQIDNNTFSQIVTKFDNTYEIIDSLFNEEITYSTYIYELDTTYIGKFGEYNYAMDLVFDGQNHIFYTDMFLEFNDFTNNVPNEENDKEPPFEDERPPIKDDDNKEFEDNISHFNDKERKDDIPPFEDGKSFDLVPPEEGEPQVCYIGELVINEEVSYKTSIEIEIGHHNDEEIEMSIEMDDGTTLLIEQETSDVEKEYSYLIKENDIKIYQEKLSFNRGKRRKDSCRLEIYDGEYYYFDDIRPNPEKEEIESFYRYSDYDSEFTMEILDGAHLYKDKFYTDVEKII